MVQTVLITGASSGIGADLARVFAQHQANLVLVARRSDRLTALKTRLEERYGVQVWTVALDLTDLAAPGMLRQQMAQDGLAIDVLVNNAGFGDYGRFVEGDWDKLNGMIQLNIAALTHLTHLFLPGMVQRGHGRILNMASTAAFQPGPWMAVYFATKAYVLSFSEAIATELKGTGVTVTALCPGPTASEFQDVSDMGKSKLIANRKLPTSEAVAEFGYRAMMRGQRVAVHGGVNRLFAFLIGFLPRSWAADWVARLQASR